MTITREQVADLREGDVVELRDDRWPGVVVRGPVRYITNNAYPHVGPAVIWPDGVEHIAQEITVVSRAPRPLYVNHPRTEPAMGDVVRDSDGVVWLRDSWATWHSPDSICNAEHEDVGLTKPWTLLVDGTTGQVVP